MLTGAEGKRLVKVLHELLGGSCLSGIVSGRLDAAGKRLLAVESDNIISLPAVNGYLRPAELLYDLFGIDAVFCILLFCFFVDCVHVDLLI
ncbi:unknown [Candidatus Colimorpha enterica]|uniref:Uncharacterized protein n=1 Tax=Candidatus Colimorpha enterica TaxID=3083063 RepID=R6TR16_9BACT|nr:unknown [Candidatus Colimorpha enterica]